MPFTPKELLAAIVTAADEAETPCETSRRLKRVSYERSTILSAIEGVQGWAAEIVRLLDQQPKNIDEESMFEVAEAADEIETLVKRIAVKARDARTLS